MKKTLAMTLIVGLFVLSGCVGPFALTKKLNKGIRGMDKGTTGSKWASEGVFLVCAILPVYAITILGDALIFNSIQFWGGDNPITSKHPLIIKDNDKQVVVKYNKDKNLMDIYTFNNYRPQGHFWLTPDKTGKMNLYTADGKRFWAQTAGDGYILKTQ
jgi:hypothetical protein